MGICIIYTTHQSKEEADIFVASLVRDKWIACGNVMPIDSCYWWKNEIANDSEYVALLKTRTNLWAKLQERMDQIHPYEVPCFIKIEVEANASYAAWILENTRID